MAAPVKRKLEFDVSEVQDTITNATIHGVVGYISPIKTSSKDPTKKYFNAAISDGKKTMRMVSFDPELRPQLAKMAATDDNAKATENSSDAVALVNCIVKRNSFRQRSDSDPHPTFELLLTNKSKVMPSPLKKFRVASGDFQSVMQQDCLTVGPSTLITISDLHLVPVNQRVTFDSVKVLLVREVEEIVTRRESKHLKKQDCVIADSQATCHVVLWENDIGKLSLNSSYRLEHLSTRIFNDTKYVSISSSTIIHPIDDIITVSLPPTDADEVTSYDGEIVAVNSIEEYFDCLFCKGQVHQCSSIVGICSKCGLQVKLKKCGIKKWMANVKMQSLTGEIQDATFFESQLRKILPSELQLHEETSMMIEALLNIEKLNVCVNKKNIVIDVNFSD